MTFVVLSYYKKSLANICLYVKLVSTILSTFDVFARGSLCLFNLFSYFYLLKLY